MSQLSELNDTVTGLQIEIEAARENSLAEACFIYSRGFDASVNEPNPYAEHFTTSRLWQYGHNARYLTTQLGFMEQRVELLKAKADRQAAEVFAAEHE